VPWLDTARLPYADNIVNLIVVSGDSPIEPGEILRVLAPNGVALYAKPKSSGKVQNPKLVKPRPAEMDEWTHFDYDAAGTGVSHDKLVKPPTALQWRLELQEYWGLGGNPAGYRPYTGFRLAGGRAFFVYNSGAVKKKGGGQKDDSTFVVARDAFNGVPLWKAQTAGTTSGTTQEYQFAASNDKLFTFTSRDGCPVALDARTGAVAVTYDKGGKLPAPNGKHPLPPAYVMLRYAAGMLFETSENKLYALDAASGALRWAWEEKDGFVCFPRVLEKEKRVFVQVVESNASNIQGRWANLRTDALLCLDMDTGKALWRSTDLKGTRLGQTIQSGERVFAFCPDGIGAGDEYKHKIGKAFCLDSTNGKLLWSSEHFNWGYNLLVRDGQPFFAAPSELTHIAPDSGKLEIFWRAGYNNRCNRSAATDDWLIMGLGIFVDREGKATVRSIARSGCAQGPFPANGLIYYTPNTCWCITQLRGHLALSAEPVRPAVADGLRLDKGPAPAAAYSGAPTPLDGPIASEWLPQVAAQAKETAPVTDGPRSYVAVIHEQRLECRVGRIANSPHEGNKTVWTFTAGGRISQPPVLHDGLCIFGSHDGCVYCLRATDGAPLWRFLAAPYERWIVSHGQVESSWPVYNVVVFEGQVCCTAGLHPETGGGIHAWGLDPHSGAIAWHKVLKRSEIIGKAGVAIAPNRVLNAPLSSDGKQLSIVGLSFRPDEPDADIQTRIDKGSLGDKNRNLGWTLRGAAIKNEPGR